MLALLKFCCLWSGAGFVSRPRSSKPLEGLPAAGLSRANERAISWVSVRDIHVAPLTRQPMRQLYGTSPMPVTSHMEPAESLEELVFALDMSLDFNPYDVRFSVQLNE